MRLASIAVAFLSLVGFVESSDKNVHVCVIGGGIAGASVASTLHRECDAVSFHITVFERSNDVGGRVRTIQPAGLPPIEAGASIIASSNKHLSDFARRHNLTQVKPSGGSSNAMWDGEQFVFRSRTWSPLTIAAAFLRYGMALLRARRHTADLVRKYTNLYLHSLEAKRTVMELLTEADLFEYTQRSFHNFSRSFSERYNDEMLGSITRVNYAQEHSTMNALAASVALAGSGDALWRVKEGNQELVRRVLTASSADIRLNSRVTSVLHDQGRYQIHLESVDPTVECDAVVLAAPYETAGIELPQFIAAALDVDRKYQRLHVTFVKGNLNKRTFGLNPPDAIYTTAGTMDVFNSVGMVAPGVYKVFSKDELNQDALARIFEAKGQIVARFDWLAYPRFTHKERFAPFDVHPDGAFWYVNTLESAGSAMEMSAVAATNVARLVASKFALECARDAPDVNDEL